MQSHDGQASPFAYPIAPGELRKIKTCGTQGSLLAADQTVNQSVSFKDHQIADWFS